LRAGSGGAGQRLGLITIDQIVGGASNILATVLAARLLSVGSFGFMGIIFIVYALLIGVGRALVSDPLLVHPHEAEDRPDEVLATTLMLAVGLAAVTAAAAVVVRLSVHTLGSGLLVLAAVLPLLAVQDLGRYLGFATQRPIRSLVLDTAWLLIMIVAVVVLVATGHRSLVWFIAAWGGSGAISGLLLFWQYRGIYRMRMSTAWLRSTWSFSWRYLVSYVSTQGATLATAGAAVAIIGSRGLGAVQGTVLLIRPFATFQVAAVAAGVSEISRTPDDHPTVRRHAWRTSRVAAPLALANMAVLLVLPDRVGVMILGATWHATKPLLVPTGLEIVFLGILTGGRAGLLGMRQIHTAMLIDIAATVAFLVATIGGGLADGAYGALWALASAECLFAMTWWTLLLRRTRPEGAPADASAPDLGVVPAPGPPL